ncbi:MAG: hypothetical protein WKF43_08270 [Acidimicrobiales bacterium]
MAEPRIPNPAPYPAEPPSAWSPRPVPPPPPTGPPPRQGRDATVAIVALAVAFAVLVAAGIGWVVVRSNDREPQTVAAPETSTSTSTSSTIAPTTSTIVPTTPSSTAPPASGPATTLEAALPDLVAFVERERGHRFRTRPVVDAIAPADFDAKLRADLVDERASIAADQVTFQALGLIEPTTDLAAVYDSLLSASALGFYDPDTKELYVEGETVTPLRRAVIVHELTHALDDQYFDLDRSQALDERPDESAFGFLSLIEGSARRVENAYRETLSVAERGEVSAEERQLAGAIDVLSLPISLIFLQQIPYLAGEALARRLVDQGGAARLDRAFRAPPETSEQVIDATRYDSQEPALPVSAPPADGTVADRGAFGSVDLQATLLGSDVVGALEALSDQSGWGGAPTSPGGRPTAERARVRLVGDTAADTARFRNDLFAWVADHEAEVTEVVDPAVADRPVIEMNRCA